MTSAIGDNPESKPNKQLYLRMFLFALIGFVLFFGGAWLRLIQVGAFKIASNPYADPPHVRVPRFAARGSTRC